MSQRWRIEVLADPPAVRHNPAVDQGLAPDIYRAAIVRSAANRVAECQPRNTLAVGIAPKRRCVTHLRYTG